MLVKQQSEPGCLRVSWSLLIGRWSPLITEHNTLPGYTSRTQLGEMFLSSIRISLKNTFCLLLVTGTSLLVALSDCQIKKHRNSKTMLCLDHRDKWTSRQLSKCANVENPPTSTRKNRMMALLECLRRPFTLNKRLPGSLCPHQRIVGAFSRAETKPIKLGGKKLRVQSMLVCIKHWILRSFTLDHSAPCKTSVWSTLPWSVVVCF